MQYVLYHANCYDGFGAAFAVWLCRGDDDTKYIPVSYGEPLPEMPDATKVFIVDFSYPAEVLLNLAERVRVVVIDHHRTAEENLRNITHHNIDVKFNMLKSGAMLTWEYFHMESEPRPKLIDHIQDRDLWKFELEGTREIHAALISHPFDFELWNTFDIDLLRHEGATLLRMQSQEVAKICKNSWMAVVAGHSVPVVNTTVHWSEVGEYLICKYANAPFVACFTAYEKKIQWSLRSKGSFDVSKVARQFGGGGHRNAAGFATVGNLVSKMTF